MERKASASSKEKAMEDGFAVTGKEGDTLCFLSCFSVEERLRKSGTEEGYEGP